MIGSKPLGYMPKSQSLTYLTNTSTLKLTSTSYVASISEFSINADIVLTAIAQAVSGNYYTNSSVLKITTSSALDSSTTTAVTGNLKVLFSSSIAKSLVQTHTLKVLSSAELSTGLSTNFTLKIVPIATLVSGTNLTHSANIHITALSEFLTSVYTSASTDPLAILSEPITGVCLNLTTGGHSFYTNYEFDEIITNKNTYYGVKDGNVYLLEGLTDNGRKIDWLVQYPNLDFGSSVKKNLQDVYVYMRTNGIIGICTNIDDEKRRTGYEISTNDRLGLVRRRKLLPKGIIGTTWQLILYSIAGSDIELKDVTVIAEKTQRVN